MEPSQIAVHVCDAYNVNLPSILIKFTKGFALIAQRKDVIYGKIVKKCSFNKNEFFFLISLILKLRIYWRIDFDLFLQ